jgi:demethylmenaquinone methyltransferase/2-methoxy-6-polyprenyl-1,4-benzoquinol methylase
VSSGLPPVADKPRYVASLFGRIAGRYDLMNTLMTAGQDHAWRQAVAAEVFKPSGSIRRPMSILDVGTGTGKLARTLLNAGSGARVAGVDFTYEMLRLAPSGLRLAAGDALRLPFADGQFDAVVSGFVMRNLADVDQGIQEQVRVLRGGGRLVILETTPGPPGILRPLFTLYFRRCVPLLGQLIAGDASAYTYLPASTLAFLEPDRLAAALREHGLIDVSVRRLALGSIGVTSAHKAVMLPRTGDMA